MMNLVFASNNLHKLTEVRAILADNATVMSLHDIGFLDDIEEIGDTLEANSAIKARTVWQWLQTHPMSLPIDGVFADDTGLEVQVLHGEPGVRTARWAGEPANDANNRLKLLTSLDGITNRHARFRTVITLIRDGVEQQVEGVVNGEIALSESGLNGFGYDPLFIPEGYTEPFACLESDVKNRISHRANALVALKEIL